MHKLFTQSAFYGRITLMVRRIVTLGIGLLPTFAEAFSLWLLLCFVLVWWRALIFGVLWAAVRPLLRVFFDHVQLWAFLKTKAWRNK
jgi:hypothetical protein